MKANRISFTDNKIPPSLEDFAITSTYSSSIAPEGRDELIQAITYMQTLEDNWNGYGAKKPFELVIEAAKRFIKSMPLNRLYPNNVSPDGEGGIVFKWHKESGERVLLVFEPGLLHLASEAPKKEPVFIDNIVYTGEENIIPQKLLPHIPERKANNHASKK